MGPAPMSDGYRRCLKERAFIQSGGYGPPNVLNAIGDADWWVESTFHWKGNDMALTLNDYRDRCHEANRRWWLDLGKPCENCDGSGKVTQKIHVPERQMDCPSCGGLGYLHKDRNLGELLMLAVSELAEALEGHRKNRMDDHLPHRKMAEVELVDFLIRMFDVAGGLGLDLNQKYGTTVEGMDLTAIAAGYYTAFKFDFDNFPEALLEITQECVHLYSGYPDAANAICTVAIVKTLWLMVKNSMDINGAFEEKMAYNAQRADHKVENRLKEGGKAY